jgi:FAD-dependent urate hydroxylase
MQIVIVGAGMGGLSAGIALTQAGHDVEIYDRVSILRAAGAAISVWSNGIKVLNALGLEQEVATIGGQMDRMGYYNSEGQVLTDFSLSPLMERVGQRPYPISRTALQTLLLETFGQDRVHLGRRCVGVKQEGNRAIVRFENGESVDADLVIGADGARSVVRDYVVGRAVERQYVGYVNWNGLIEMNAEWMPEKTWVMYVGDYKRVSLMPAGKGQLYFFLDVPLPIGTVNDVKNYRSELLAFFQGWAEPVQRLIQTLDPDRTNRIEIHDIEPLEQFVRDRFVLLGDAAHSMAPDLGQGGCLALEDAWVLSHCLTPDVASSLTTYEQLRLERSKTVVQRARQRSNVTHGKDPQRTVQWYEELKTEDGSNIIDGICKTILGGPL